MQLKPQITQRSVNSPTIWAKQDTFCLAEAWREGESGEERKEARKIKKERRKIVWLRQNCFSFILLKYYKLVDRSVFSTCETKQTFALTIGIRPFVNRFCQKLNGLCICFKKRVNNLKQKQQSFLTILNRRDMFCFSRRICFLWSICNKKIKQNRKKGGSFIKKNSLKGEKEKQ